jgi:hypothetical protein
MSSRVSLAWLRVQELNPLQPDAWRLIRLGAVDLVLFVGVLSTSLCAQDRIGMLLSSSVFRMCLRREMRRRRRTPR